MKISLLILALVFNYQNVFTQENWDDFTAPILIFIDADMGNTEGSKMYHALVPDKNAYILPVCEDVSRLLFIDPMEASRVSGLYYKIENYNGVSEKGGSTPLISIRFSTKHIENTWAATEDSLAVESEIYGVLFHELTHGYQLEPVGAGIYDGASPFWAHIEGLADAVRIRAGYHQNTKPKDNSKKWLAGYTDTGYFYNWIANNYDCDFLQKLNLSITGDSSWEFSEVCENLVNKSGNELWSEYRTAIGASSKPKIGFSSDQTTIALGESIQFENLSSEDAFCFDWNFEGGTPRRSKEVNPNVFYNKPGKYKVTLVGQNKSAEGTGIEVKDHYITVLEPNSLELNPTLSFHVYPNPSRDYFSIENYPELNVISYELISVTRGRVDLKISDDGRVNFNSLKKGIYYLKLQTKKDFSVQKLIRL